MENHKYCEQKIKQKQIDVSALLNKNNKTATV